MRDDLEYRAGIELRAIGGRRLGGTAAPFNVRTQIGRVTELIRPGAFAASLRSGADVLGLVDHDPTRLLARTKAGTLRLSEDASGLQFEMDVPPTQLGNDVLALAELRSLGGMSIGFRAISEDWPTENTRELRSVELVEVSIATAFAAYPSTTIALRSRQASSRELVSATGRRRLLDMA